MILIIKSTTREDGPTHQPIETIPSLRLIPDLTVMRPADGNETAGAYKYAVERSKYESRPTMMAFSRQALPNIPNSSIENTMKGAYEVTECADPEVIIIGTGSEVHVCLDAAKAMDQKVRVVSMPSVEVFRAQTPCSRRASQLLALRLHAHRAGRSSRRPRWASTSSVHRLRAVPAWISLASTPKTSRPAQRGA
eukprot:s6209_g4.t1